MIAPVALANVLAAYFIDGGFLLGSFSSGKSIKMENVLRKAALIPQDVIDLCNKIIRGCIIVSMTFNLIELGCYALIFVAYQKSNMSTKPMISKNVFELRRKRNVITMTGQAFSFVMEFGMAIAINCMISMQVDSAIYVICLISASSILSLLHVLTSHELRRYLNIN